MAITVTLLVLGALLLVWFICEKIKGCTVKAAIIKSMVSVFFISCGNAVLEMPMKLNFGKLRGIVIGYGILLFATMFVSGGLAMLYGWQESTLNLIFAGSILFALSDLILSGTFFGVGKERPIDIALNYLSYYPAQFFIALSLLFVR